MMRITKEKKYKTRFQELAAVAFHLTLMMISYSFTTKNFEPQNKHLNCKQDQITNDMSLFMKTDNFHMFCTQITKFSDFCADMHRQKVMLLRNGRSDFRKIYLKRRPRTQRKK